MIKKLRFFAFLYFTFSQVMAQQIVPQDTIPARIKDSTVNGQTHFKSELRPLRQIAGAPEPFYTYFWEFGDGHFSFEKEPVHPYFRSDSIWVRLYATNNYDDGKRPPTRPKPIKPGTSKPMVASNVRQSGLFKSGGYLDIKTNCMPKPGDDMMLVLGYRNPPESGLEQMGGTVAILYNDKAFANDNFELAESRSYHQERKTTLQSLLTINGKSQPNQGPVYFADAGKEAWLSSLLGKAETDQKQILRERTADFRSSETWQFSPLHRGEERFLFLHFKTTPEMVKDTNAVVRIGAVFIPDNPMGEISFFDMELQIVASHDPNKMVLKKSRMNFRLTGKTRQLDYKVRFQNTGKGPAKKVAVAVRVPEIFDLNTLKITGTKPAVIPCDSAYVNQSCMEVQKAKDSVHFVFHHIYLPGTQQDGVKDSDSTMGFVSYSIRFREKPKKLPIPSGAAIVFDKNEPIYTNRAVGRFKMGLSPSVIAGYGFPFSNGRSYAGDEHFTLGVGLAPYSPYRPHWQLELYLSNSSEKSYLVSSDESKRDTLIGREGYLIARKDHFRTEKLTSIHFSPLQLRHHFTSFLGVGIGSLITMDWYSKRQDRLHYELQSAQGIENLPLDVLVHESIQHFTHFRYAFFADIQLGLVRVGPAAGLRGIYDPRNNRRNFAAYLIWKF